MESETQPTNNPPEDCTIESSSGNIFEDLQEPDAEELFLRSKLMMQVTEIIKSTGLKQKEIARILQTDQSKISELMNGKLSRFSLEKLLEFVVLLGFNVEIRFKRSRRRTGKGHVEVVPIKSSRKAASG